MASDFGPALTALGNGLAGSATAAWSRSDLPALMNLGYSEGMSGREMLTLFRANGIAISNSAYWQMAADVRGGIANVKTVGGLDLGAIPGADAFAVWEKTRQSGYLYKFQAIFTRPGLEPGSIETITRWWNYSSYRPQSIGDVLYTVTDQINNPPPDTQQEYDETFVGLQLANLYRMEP